MALGQIAHADRDRSNNSLDNLMYLCLRHHDMYDSRTSLSKGFLPDEIKGYRDQLYADRDVGREPPTVPSPPLMMAGRDISVRGNIVVGSVNHVIIRGARRKSNSPLIIPGTVAEDCKMHNYLNYLVRRYIEFKSWECKRKGIKFRGGAIHGAYQKLMKCPVRHTPKARFEEAAEYLQARIRNTQLGRIKGAEGNLLYESFDDYPS